MTEGEEKTRNQLKFRRAEKTLIKIIDEEWARGKISPQELKGGSQRRKVSGLRAAIAKWDLDESGLSLAEIARHVGVTASSIARADARLEEEEKTSG